MATSPFLSFYWAASLTISCDILFLIAEKAWSRNENVKLYNHICSLLGAKHRAVAPFLNICPEFDSNWHLVLRAHAAMSKRHQKTIGFYNS